MRHTLGPTTTRRPEAAVVVERVWQGRAWQGQHQRCVGCETQGRPGRSGRPSLLHPRSGNRRRRSRRSGAATAIEWRAVRPEARAVVRSTLPQAEAVVSALVRTPVHRVVRSPVRGEAGTGDARSAPGRAGGDARSRRSRPGRARRGLRRALREASARGERGGGPDDGVERCADRVGPAAAVSVSEPPGKRSAQ